MRHLWISIVVFAALLAALVGVVVRYELLRLRVLFADEQISIFEEMKSRAETASDPHGLAELLEYTLTYYPSGTKQVSGTELDRMVETARSNGIATIVARLRVVTRRDLGNTPEAWLKDYGRDSGSSPH